MKAIDDLLMGAHHGVSGEAIKLTTTVIVTVQPIRDDRNADSTDDVAADGSRGTAGDASIYLHMKYKSPGPYQDPSHGRKR